jgi:hypothetical protein
MTLFTFDSSQLNLQGAVFRFDLVQTITEISLFFFIQKIFRRLHHFAKHEIKFYSIIVRDSISYNFVHKRQFLNLIWLNRQKIYRYFC